MVGMAGAKPKRKAQGPKPNPKEKGNKVKEKKAKKATTAAPVKKKGKKVVSSAVMEEERKPKRRQLARRDTEEQCERFVERKLSHIDNSRLKGIRNAEGQTVEQFIREELRKTNDASRAASASNSWSGSTKASI